MPSSETARTDEDTVARVAAFHGHMCPGLALGIRAAEVALDEIGPHSSDEEVVAIVETDMCGVDAVQYLTGCTFGKGNLVHRDYGKNVFTFVRRSDRRAVRVSMRPGGFGPDDPGREQLRAKIRAGTATAEERARFWQLQAQRSQRVLAAPLEELYDVGRLELEPPRPARVFASLQCDACGEPTMETRIRRLHGQQLCPPCFDDRLAGRTAVPLSPRPADTPAPR